MHLVEFFLIFGIPVLTYAAHNPPKGLYFVGVGYNLLKGNPEGGASSIGGIDPGLLSTRKIFQLTWKTKKLSSDKMYNVPDQVSFAPFHSCVEENSTNAVFGAKSYQEELKIEVGAEGKNSSRIFGDLTRLIILCTNWKTPEKYQLSFCENITWDDNAVDVVT